VSLKMDARGNAFLAANSDTAEGIATVRRYDAASDTWDMPGITVGQDPCSPSTRRVLPWSRGVQVGPSWPVATASGCRISARNMLRCRIAARVEMSDSSCGETRCSLSPGGELRPMRAGDLPSAQHAERWSAADQGGSALKQPVKADSCRRQR
jgi:hypothetical protein